MDVLRSYSKILFHARVSVYLILQKKAFMKNRIYFSQNKDFVYIDLTQHTCPKLTCRTRHRPLRNTVFHVRLNE